MKKTLLLLLGALAFSASVAFAQPNIIFILADDLGLDNLSCYGSDVHTTPNIDRLAQTGTRFEMCFASPLCGPSRCALMTGRYAFRTGGLTNNSWRAGGPGAKSMNERPVAKLLKQAGYATCLSGKWRQMGETPRDWGFDEYCTDPTGDGWYWEDSYIKNGETIMRSHYNPNVIQEFSLDFIRRNSNASPTRPFFLYYAMHLVHVPTLHTPISPPTDGPARYKDNIAFMDKQVGELVAELNRLGIRNNTLIIFSGDNGTLGGPDGYASTIGGLKIDGWKGSMLEGGSRVPFIASWPGKTPAGAVSGDIVNFTDMLSTFVELGGGTLPQNFKFDSHSLAPQLRGNKGNPRKWAFVQKGATWFVRSAGFKMNEKGELFDMSDAPFDEHLVLPRNDTNTSKAARTNLAAILAELDPASGKTDTASATGAE